MYTYNVIQNKSVLYNLYVFSISQPCLRIYHLIMQLINSKIKKKEI